MNVSSEGPGSFYLDVSNYYGVPQQQVYMLRDRRLPDEEIPVALYIAAQAHIGPEIVLEQRLGGRTWMDIALMNHLSPGIFYVPFSGDPGPPYGRAYGYYRNHRRSQWNTIRLADADVVNMVNLKFASEHYGYSPNEVVRFRGQGGRFDRLAKKGAGRPGGGGRELKSHGNGGGEARGMRQEKARGMKEKKGRDDGDDDDAFKGKGHGNGGGHGRK